MTLWGFEPVWSQDAVEEQPSQSESSADRQDQGDQEQAQPSPFIAALNGIESAVRDLITDVDEIEQKNAQEREQRDLEAQEQMAHWAKFMFWATFVTVVLTALALWTIIKTLDHTRRAAEAADGMLAEAIETTKAARETVAVTQRIGSAQVRGYLSIMPTGVGVDEVPDQPDTTKKIKITCEIKNSGQSPAYSAQTHARIWVQDRNAAPYNFDVEPLVPCGSSTSVVVSGASVNEDLSRTIDLPPTGWRALNNGQSVICLACYVSYVDVFDEDVSTPIGAGHFEKFQTRDAWDWRFVWHRFTVKEATEGEAH